MEGLALPDFLTVWVQLAALAFARIGTAVLLLPGFGDTQIPARIRIALGLVLTLALIPALPLPTPPEQLTALALLIGGEAVIGIFIGTAYAGSKPPTPGTTSVVVPTTTCMPEATDNC